MGEGSRWKDHAPPERAWKRRKGTSPSGEQDRAAGGRHHRMVDLGDGRFARASVALRVYPHTRRIRAVLRWSDRGKSPEKYLGEVENDTRAANLAEAWDRARVAGLVVEEPLPAESRASSVEVRAVMRANRGKDTKPELLLRSLLHQHGLRYRVDVRPIEEVRRRADVVFLKERVAVFIDGCFWHGCADHYRPATKNAAFWQAKIEGNRARDAETNKILIGSGWTVIRVWEHDDPAEAARNVEQVVRARREARATAARHPVGRRRRQSAVAG
ncbi:very short patch repair endonuclease [Kitasatospora aureofaciens]|uniref:very short patch repair endonuclease n=1 Tax=Kitasatospora aureofaciens TaxID=1894 RepID=UPI0033DE8712